MSPSHAAPYRSLLADLEPADLDLPSKFREFRKTQIEGVDFAMGRGPGTTGQQDKRFVAMAQPTGSGKSMLSAAIGKVSGGKFAILTATRALETQLTEEFGSCGLVNVRGRANYQCQDLELTKLDVDSGKRDCELNCEEGFERGCKYAESKTFCPYRAKVEEACDADAIVTNYQYWMNVRGRNSGALEREENPIRTLIADELHQAPNECARHIGAWLPHRIAHEHGEELFRRLIENAKGELSGKVTDEWISTLLIILRSVRDEMGRIEFDYGSPYGAYRQSKRYRGLKKVADDLEKITRYGSDGNWLWIQSQNFARVTGIRFECIWPGRYMERYVWSGVPKVVLLSATLRPKALTIAGLDEKQYRYREWPRQFPAENNPVVWLKPEDPKRKLKMGRNATSEELRASIEIADRLYDEWAPKTNILVQTASYKRAEWLAQNSRWGKYMLLNKTGEAGDMAKKFQESEPPCLLVSPSYVTGWDLPPREGRWGLIHVLKLPFPDLSDPVVRARTESDEMWYVYETAQNLQQGCGRQCRKPSDKSMVVITDDAVDRFRKRARSFFSGWWGVRDIEGIPRYPKR